MYCVIIILCSLVWSTQIKSCNTHASVSKVWKNQLYRRNATTQFTIQKPVIGKYSNCYFDRRNKYKHGITVSMKRKKESTIYEKNSSKIRYLKSMRNGTVNQENMKNERKTTRNVWDNVTFDFWHTKAGFHKRYRVPLHARTLSNIRARRQGTRREKSKTTPVSKETKGKDFHKVKVLTRRTTTQWVRTTPSRVSLEEFCDYTAYYCMKIYVTGRICARTAYWTYMTFKNYCMMDFVNCKLRWQVWHIIHMGPCLKHEDYTDYNFTISTHVSGDSRSCILQKRHGLNRSKYDPRLIFKSGKSESVITPKLYDSIPPPKWNENKTFKKNKNRNFKYRTTLRKSWADRRRERSALYQLNRPFLLRKPRRWLQARRHGDEGDYDNEPPPRVNVPAHMRGRPKPETTPPTGTESNRLIRSGPPLPAISGCSYDNKISYGCLPEYCEYYSQSCMKVYNTGIICGRTVYLTYYTFTNYCMLDYVNCMERYEVWQIAHYGPCFNISLINLAKHFHYQYSDDYWLDGHVVDPAM